ncbi:hypothetical protein C2845_PM08G30820 [Panicum miliaceum]|uniref:Calcyclin-binding protein n=1 Tax=Panicum miliaceum TaxID=4540 RepID=A0A3L6R333_PANMI|nr:hypothetical protein C2845_PM08G30820 [Panicum miliaceum]
MAGEIRSVLEDLRRLKGYAKHPVAQSLLSDQIRDYEAKLVMVKVTAQAGTSVPVVVAPAGLNCVTVGLFSWDQDRDKIRIFISIEGVEQKKMEAVFNQTSVHMKFNDVYGKNYQWAIPKLCKEIVPEKCKAVLKPTKLVVTLCKASTGTWSNIYFEENKFKPSVVNDDDPISGVVDLVKNMYQGGGDDMKQALEKAWHDTKTGKIAGLPG